MKIAVIYQSKYGATKKYATWIAESLDAQLIEKSNIQPRQLLDYDLIIYGGGIYASKLAGVDLVTKNSCKQLIVFTVGLTDPIVADYSEVLTQIKASEKQIKTFHFQGGINYKKLTFGHKTIISMLKRVASKKDAQTLIPQEQLILENYGKEIDYSNQQAIKPLIEYVKMTFE